MTSTRPAPEQPLFPLTEETPMLETLTPGALAADVAAGEWRA